ncbi:hypothetical protein F383_12502 [Gossypium arboreum]|uniref:Uncharacterized protein n=1 Tax=Gossypium arboreum TaxID=29729 RepID=A0A0B0NDX5_GOSAR|nr:hypothetical protein F383_12502 [Gossypium arboreum]
MRSHVKPYVGYDIGMPHQASSGVKDSRRSIHIIKVSFWDGARKGWQNGLVNSLILSTRVDTWACG